MRRFCVCLLAAGVLPAVVPAQPPPAAGPAPWANKMFVPDVGKNPAQDPPASVTHDFGTVPHGTVLTHTFTLTNIYDAPLQVVDVRLTSGSLKVSPPERVLQPHDAAAFTVTLDTTKVVGPTTQVVYATVGPNHVSTAVLRLVANSRPDVALLAPGALDFGTVPAGTAAGKKVVLEYTGKQRDWAVTEVARPAGPVEVAVRPLGRGRFEVSAAVSPDAAPGPLAETVLLRTNDPAAPAVPVPVRGFVQAPVQAAPDRVNAGVVRVGTPWSARVVVRGNGVGAFKVDPVQDAGDGVSVETLGREATVHAVTLRFTPSAPGLFRKEIPVRTTLNGGTTVVVALEAVVEP